MSVVTRCAAKLPRHLSPRVKHYAYFEFLHRRNTRIGYGRYGSTSFQPRPSNWGMTSVGV
jgi:hypothetical protein